MDERQRLKARAALAPDGVLRAGINLRNPLLVRSGPDELPPRGLAPAMAHEIAQALEVAADLVPYTAPDLMAREVGRGWAVAMLAIEASRAETIAFSPPYAELPVLALAAPTSTLSDATQIDRAGVTVVAASGSAYALWLETNLRYADLVTPPSAGEAAALMRGPHGGERVMVGLRPALQAADVPGARMLAGRVTSAGQAVGLAHGQPDASAFVADLVDSMRRSGRLDELVETWCEPASVGVPTGPATRPGGW